MKIETFLKERNEMLLACDIDRSIEFHKKHSPGMTVPSREVVEIGLHKARTAISSLPVEERIKSKQWLESRGYKSMDDGNI